ncbi:DUF3320 domain-containing protein [Occultella gossypii]|uniref:DUF3320 domain-containing protein n=1 Tax=Occultella gossypii TaxID=2800820 RepID=A0ABS7SEY2_9MICO|nr:DUF3320 domain-containing protein [Occultella gossypii]MBZ2197813.1 DUF3320 domain-containing protein [Occultella gossypii]
MTTPISLEVDALDVLSYAMAHNGLAVVGQVRIASHDVDLLGARMRVRVLDVQGDLARPCVVAVDLARGQETVVRDVPLVLDPSAMAQVEEDRPAEIVVDVLPPVDGTNRDETDVVSEPLARIALPVRLLAAQHWLRSEHPVTTEVLASFVMPNHPAISQLLGEAGEILRTETGSASLEGYQSGPERVDELARAIFTAAHARGIRYAEAPSSWSAHGQKVRTPGEVLDGRIGTCLDTVVVLAAALEQAGIRPLVWIVAGHAFLGYWRQPTSLGVVYDVDTSRVVNLIDVGVIGLIETTLVTAAELPDRATVARQPYSRFLTGDLRDVYGVLDVHEARRNRILPLPARVRTDDGNVTVVEYRPPTYTPPGGAPSASGSRESPDGEEPSRAKAPPRVQQWKNSLLDLSLGNKLIKFSERNAIHLAVPPGELARLEDTINAGTSISLLPADSVDAVHTQRGISVGAELDEEMRTSLLHERRAVYSDVPGAAYQGRMRGLAHRARTIVEDTGANNLYLALGSLIWSVGTEQLRSPLVLVPVTLRTRSKAGAYTLTLDESGSSTPNFCLLEKLKQLFDLEIPGLTEPTDDHAGVDLDATLAATRMALVKAGLNFRVEATADLAILQFAKFRLWKDLDENWEQFDHNPLVHHLIHTPTDAFADPAPPPAEVDLDELASGCPVPADSSQLAAIAEAVAGRTFVLEGPPGTGKSQTITNLLTRSVAAGKRVLFVAEKRAALDVVRRRLEDVGMGPFSIDLHDRASRPNAVRAQISRALELAIDTDTQGFAAATETLRSTRRRLARYAAELHEPNGAGLSLYSAHTQRLTLRDEPRALPVPTRLVAAADPAVLAGVRRALEVLPDVADPAQPRPHHPWGFVGLVDPHAVPAAALLGAVRRVDVAVDAAGQALVPSDGFAGAVSAARSVRELHAVVTIATSPAVLADLDAVRSAAGERARTDLRTALVTFVRDHGDAVARVALPNVLDLPVSDIHAAAQSAAASGFFGRRRRLRAVLETLRPGLRTDVDVSHKEVVEVTTMLAGAAHAAGQVRDLAVRAPGVHLSPDWNPLLPEHREHLDSQLAWSQWAARALTPDPVASSRPAQDPGPDESPATAVTALRGYLDARATGRVGEVDPAATGVVAELLAAFTELDSLVGAAAPGAPEDPFAPWAGRHGLLRTWTRTTTGRDLTDPQLLPARRWAAFLGGLEPLRSAGLARARDQLREGVVHADDAVRALDLGVAESSVSERSGATGLAGFDPLGHGRTISRFTTSAREVRDHLTTIVPREVLASRRFDPEAGGRVGALRRELGRQRGGLAVRALLRAYGDLITQVMPCVLVSPDSLARFFPARADQFDLVVFDEASQIRVADAVGAMGRANGVIVVGDSKQMPPTSFGEPLFEGGDDEFAVEAEDVIDDEESILTECIQSRVPQRWLSWHYRSKDESLIAFSNTHYYENRLSSFPAPNNGAASPDIDGVGVSLVRVDGQFHRTGKGRLLRTNPVEADAIVAEIIRRFDAHPYGTPSIGVVTFNVQQRNHIESLLRDAGDDRLRAALDDNSEGLFVKNLENVQGDERDVILFSTAFGVNDRGVLPLNFGPLNRAGGERRLNVAVTRARRQVVVFSSFDPDQLRSEQTSSVGIKHLRNYLDMAAHGPQVLGTIASAPRRTIIADRHREQVAASLRDLGLVAHTDVGLSDFKVDLSLALPERPDHPVVAVLLDGPGWAGRGTVGDRDGLPVEVLSAMMRWPAVERLWLPAWLKDPDGEARRLLEATHAAERAAADREEAERETEHLARTAAAEQAATALAADEPEQPILTGLSTADERSEPVTASVGLAVPFQPWDPQPLGVRSVLDALPAARAAHKVQQAIESIVAQEGPVHTARLTRLVANSFGLTKVAETRAQAILGQVPTDLPVQDQFVWPRGLDPDDWRGYRTQTSSSVRPLDHVSSREIANAMADLARASAGITSEELLRATTSVFGGSRLTDGIRTRLERALGAALTLGLLTERGQYLAAHTD